LFGPVAVQVLLAAPVASRPWNYACAVPATPKSAAIVAARAVLCLEFIEIFLEVEVQGSSSVDQGQARKNVKSAGGDQALPACQTGHAQQARRHQCPGKCSAAH
jgi:hypothetical protein